jgi:hypothetical protein
MYVQVEIDLGGAACVGAVVSLAKRGTLQSEFGTGIQRLAGNTSAIAIYKPPFPYNT